MKKQLIYSLIIGFLILGSSQSSFSMSSMSDSGQELLVIFKQGPSISFLLPDAHIQNDGNLAQPLSLTIKKDEETIYLSVSQTSSIVLPDFVMQKGNSYKIEILIGNFSANKKIYW